MLHRLLRASPYIVLQIAAMALYQVAAGIEYPATPGRIGPDFWPKSILVLMGLVCVYEIVKNLMVGESFTAAGLLEKFMKESGEDPTDEVAHPMPSYWWRLAGGVVLTIAYVSVIDKLGFFIATAVFLALFMVLGRYRRWGVIAAASLGGSLLFVFVFMKLVYVSLPLGVEPFATVSQGLLTLMGVH